MMMIQLYVAWKRCLMYEREKQYITFEGFYMRCITFEGSYQTSEDYFQFFFIQFLLNLDILYEIIKKDRSNKKHLFSVTHSGEHVFLWKENVWRIIAFLKKERFILYGGNF